jgi:hypothetical protein
MAARWIVVLIVIAVAGAGCEWRKQHLTPGFGSSYDAAFRAQAPPRKGGPARPADGLDSQEAAIIAETYRTSLAPKDAKPRDEPILIVAPPSPNGAPKLMPSVPQER